MSENWGGGEELVRQSELGGRGVSPLLLKSGGRGGLYSSPDP